MLISVELTCPFSAHEVGTDQYSAVAGEDQPLASISEIVMIKSIQQKLEFEHCTHPIWRDPRGVGKIAVAGFGLGIGLGLHLAVLILWMIMPLPVWLVSGLTWLLANMRWR